MIETPARIVRTEGATAWVVTEAPTSCGACGGKGCGSSVFARMMHRGEPEYAVENPIHAEAGEAVVVGVEDGAVFKAALAGYLVPLALFLLGAMFGARFGEAQAVLGALLGLVLAVVWLRRRRGDARPAILRRGEVACQGRN
ncbi:MAG: SoxR reducing system RseC family protein [Hydrogenophilales bacterium]|nr:SoxR reducing system RseC family protein [Hydrogenophilales bacterium]